MLDAAKQMGLGEAVIRVPAIHSANKSSDSIALAVERQWVQEQQDPQQQADINVSRP